MSDLAWLEGKPKGSLKAFLLNNPPSKTFMPKDGDGWIWVRSNRERDTEDKSSSKSIEKARGALEGLAERFKEIEDNPKIPKVKSKTSGPSKKMMKENAAQQTEQQLRKFGKEWPSGKWLFYERANFVDSVFSKLAESLINGPLSKLPNAKCHTIKVSTADDLHKPSSSNHRKEPTSVICLYFDDIWNADHAKEVLECVVKEHGELPNSAKADLYTIIGLDSHHPSKLRSTLYRPAEILNDELLKEWQANFRAKQKRKSEGENESNGGVVKKRVVENGHVVPVRPEDYWSKKDDDDEEDFEEEQSPKPKTSSIAKIEEVPPLQARQETYSPPKEAESKEPPTKTQLTDSDTEEEDEIIMTAAPRKNKGTPSMASSSTPKKNSTSATAKQPTTSTSSSSPIQKQETIKQTILPTTSTSKKRDRFGRSDF